MIKISGCCLILAILFSCCKKEEAAKRGLPEITREGKNTFGCYVNGELWLPLNEKSGSGGSFSATGFPALKAEVQHDSSFLLQASFVPDIYGVDMVSAFHFHLKPVRTGTFALGLDYNASAIYQDTNFWMTYYEVRPYEGELTIIHLDTTNRIISGTFWFNAFNEQKWPTPRKDSVIVREGRFDVRYYY